MKRTLLAILLLFALLSCNKKKKEEEPYVPVKQTYTDIPGTDIYIANTDSVFVDTGLVITVKGKGFDPKYKGHYTMKSQKFDVFYSHDNLPEIPEMIYFDATTIKFRYPRKYFKLESCRPNSFDFVFVKYSDDPMAELNYQKRFLAVSGSKRFFLKNHIKIFKDTAYLKTPRRELAYFFLEYYGGYTCNLALQIGAKYIDLEPTRTAIWYETERNCHSIGIPLDSSYGISDGYYPVKLFKNGEQLYCEGEKSGVYVKNIK